jgi:hypothetical protein
MYQSEPSALRDEVHHEGNAWSTNVNIRTTTATW